MNLLLQSGVPADRFPSSIQFRSTPPAVAPADQLWRASIADTMALHTRGTPAPAPMTSAVLAGWVCVSLGLVMAWFFPLAHFFFSLGLIMAVIAMATHQVRAGLLLLAGSLAASVLCALVFLSGVVALIHATLSPPDQPTSPLRSEFQPEPPRFATPGFPRPFAAPIPQAGVVAGNGFQTASVHPWRLDDIKLMLRTGLSDAEIIAAIAGCPRTEDVGPSEAAERRARGAGSRLLDQLRTSRLSVGSAPGFLAGATASNPMPSVNLPRPPVNAPATPASTPVDYAARDRRLESLKQQIDNLDDQIRTVRTNPLDRRYHWLYAGSGNGGVNQFALQKYLDQLDQQRNALRREKWQLDGR